MAEKKIACILATALFFCALAGADPCGTLCGSPCTYTRCEIVSGVDGGCWWDGSSCHNCRVGDKDVKKCSDYTSLGPCRLNPCQVGGDCKWEAGACLSIDEDVPGCMTAGCKAGYRCMADGECVYSTVSIQKYCNTGYKQHGFSNDASNSAACEDIGKACSELDAKCRLVGNETTGSRRKDECLTLRNMCMQCQGDCELRRSEGNIEGVIYGLAAGLATLAILFNAVTLISSEDEVARKNAKKGMVYVLLSLMIIFSAVKIVEYLWTAFS